MSSMELVICGYLRSVINDEKDYSVIFAIIILFYEQGFAQHFDENIDKDYKQKMRFGDILRKESDDAEWHEYMVMNMNNELEYIGNYEDFEVRHQIVISIPLHICQHLNNAILFYSKLHDIKFFKWVDHAFVSFFVKHDDEWIIKHFNGPLDPNYKSIEIAFYNGSLDTYRKNNVKICYVEGYKKGFDLINSKISNQDVTKYFEIRKDAANLVKIKVEVYKQTKDDYDKYPQAVSVLWEVINAFRFNELHVTYIGPKSEKDAMMDKVKEFYNDECNVFMIDIQDKDCIPKS